MIQIMAEEIDGELRLTKIDWNYKKLYGEISFAGLDEITELHGTLSKVATGICLGLSIASGIIAGCEKYASVASVNSDVGGGIINIGINIGAMYASTTIATAAMGALAASSLAIPDGIIILSGAIISVCVGIAINHLFTKLVIAGNTIEGHLNNFVDWLIFWD